MIANIYAPNHFVSFCVSTMELDVGVKDESKRKWKVRANKVRV
jgi:hypothetical protein